MKTIKLSNDEQYILNDMVRGEISYMRSYLRRVGFVEQGKIIQYLTKCRKVKDKMKQFMPTIY